MQELSECGCGWLGAVVVLVGFAVLSRVAGRRWQRRQRMTLAFMHVSKARFGAGAGACGQPAVLLTPARERLPLHDAPRKFVGPGTHAVDSRNVSRSRHSTRLSVGLFSSSQRLDHNSERQTEHDRHPSETHNAPCPFRTSRVGPDASLRLIGRVVAAVS